MSMMRPYRGVCASMFKASGSPYVILLMLANGAEVYTPDLLVQFYVMYTACACAALWRAIYVPSATEYFNEGSPICKVPRSRSSDWKIEL